MLLSSLKKCEMKLLLNHHQILIDSQRVVNFSVLLIFSVFSMENSIKNIMNTESVWDTLKMSSKSSVSQSIHIAVYRN